MKEKKGFVKEFKEFIARGNVMDMAVGVIIGGAFGAISSSLVNDIIMPLVSMLTGTTVARVVRARTLLKNFFMGISFLSNGAHALGVSTLVPPI